jgi:steroid delta-isomerase-like uncharacterized protein
LQFKVFYLEKEFPMTRTENKSIIRRFIEEGLNKRNPALIEEVYSDGYVGHDPERESPRTIIDLQQAMVGMLSKVFPDGQYSIERLVAEDDVVTWHWTFRGTHQGEIKGMPATGRKISFGGINIFRLENGKVVEDWVYRDTTALTR